MRSRLPHLGFEEKGEHKKATDNDSRMVAVPRAEHWRPDVITSRRIGLTLHTPLRGSFGAWHNPAREIGSGCGGEGDILRASGDYSSRAIGKAAQQPSRHIRMLVGRVAGRRGNQQRAVA